MNSSRMPFMFPLEFTNKFLRDLLLIYRMFRTNLWKLHRKKKLLIPPGIPSKESVVLTTQILPKIAQGISARIASNILLSISPEIL